MNDTHANLSPTDGDLDPQLDAVVRAVLSESLPVDAIARVKAHALTLEGKPHPLVRPSLRVIFSKHPSLQFVVVAACLLLAFGITMMYSPTSSAFAEAIARLKNVGAFRYRELVYLTTQAEPVESEVLVAEDGRERRSMRGIVSIHDSTGQLRLTLLEVTKSATVHEPRIGLHGPVDSKIKWLERLKSYGSKPDKELGTMNIDGRECRGFEVKFPPNTVYAIWVDPRKNELVQVEFMGMPEGSTVTKSVMERFEFNLPLDPLLFSFDAPNGYETSTAAKLPEMLPFEESLVEALMGYTELSGGKFPKSITDWGEWVTLLSKDGITRTTIAARLGSLIPYLGTMSHDDYEYTGAGKEVGKESAIVFWYRTPEKQFRAVFSDFTVAPISESDITNK